MTHIHGLKRSIISVLVLSLGCQFSDGDFEYFSDSEVQFPEAEFPEVQRTGSELLISEYVEGLGSNKAIELYNETDSTLDLSSYQLRFYFQGSAMPGTTIALVGVIAPHQTHVIVQEHAEASLLSFADQINSWAWFNGNDAVALERIIRSGPFATGIDEVQVIDVFGQIGRDPGKGWGDGNTRSFDRNLRRRSNIGVGDVNGSDFFDPEEQWKGFAWDDHSDLGQHSRVTDCGIECDNGESATELRIHQIQSHGAVSPYNGTRVQVEGIVVGDFQGVGQVGGFFVQEQDSEVDCDPQTSEGIFVADRTTDVEIGDRVKIVGRVTEEFQRTNLRPSKVIVLSRSNKLPKPTPLRLPFKSVDTPERVEGMLVTLPQTLSVSGTHELGRYGQFLVSAGRLRQPTNVARPGFEAQSKQKENLRNRLWIDDGNIERYPENIIFPGPELSANNTLRSGFRISTTLGILDHNFGSYRLLPTAPLNISSRGNARTSSPELPVSGLRVASYNVFNYFNGDGHGGGFPTSRGAHSQIEFVRQHDKLVSAILALNADIIALMEIENDGYESDSAIADLVAGLNEASREPKFAFIDPGYKRLGEDEIAVAIVYRLESVFPSGAAAILDRKVDPRFDDQRNRPSLAQSFYEISSGQRFTVVVNHFKSKSRPCDDIGDSDLGDGQGNCPSTRTLAAEALIDWIHRDPTASHDADFLLLGDFNAYAKEDPIEKFADANYSDQIDRFVGYDVAYSYVFDGQAGYLDHALASPSMSDQVVDARHWHSNADEPKALDYHTETKSSKQLRSLFAPNSYRASDHDPVVVAIDLKGHTDL